MLLVYSTQRRTNVCSKSNNEMNRKMSLNIIKIKLFRLNCVLKRFSVMFGNVWIDDFTQL